METTHSPVKQDNSEFTATIDVADISIGDYVLLRNSTCKINQITQTYLGKVGKKKILFQGVDILTGKKHEKLVRESSQIEIPIFSVSQYQLIGVSDDGYVTLLDDNCQVKEDLKLPQDNEELTQQIRSGYSSDMVMQVDVTQIMGKEIIISMKNVH